MLVAVNGIVTYMSNSSGHYMPNAQSIYNFGKWLNAKKCVHGQAIVEIDHSPPLDGEFLFPVFLNTCTTQGFVAPAGLSLPAIRGRVWVTATGRSVDRLLPLRPDPPRPRRRLPPFGRDALQRPQEAVPTENYIRQ